MENKENSLENNPVTENVDLNSQESSTITSESESNSIDYTTLVTEVSNISAKVDTLTSISIVLMIGVGVIVGIISALIFSQYFRS